MENMSGYFHVASSFYPAYAVAHVCSETLILLCLTRSVNRNIDTQKQNKNTQLVRIIES